MAARHVMHDDPDFMILGRRKMVMFKVSHGGGLKACLGHVLGMMAIDVRGVDPEFTRLSLWHGRLLFA